MFIYSICGWFLSNTAQAGDRVASQYCQRYDRFGTSRSVSSGTQKYGRNVWSYQWWFLRYHGMRSKPSTFPYCPLPETTEKHTHLFKKKAQLRNDNNAGKKLDYWHLLLLMDEFKTFIFHNWLQIKLGINVFPVKLNHTPLCISAVFL